MSEKVVRRKPVENEHPPASVEEHNQYERGLNELGKQIEDNTERGEVNFIMTKDGTYTTPEIATELTYQEAEEELVKFVQKQIELMNQNLLFGGSSEPTFYALNQSLMQYESVLFGLITLHQECRIQKSIAEEKYENFYAQKYVEVKQQQVSLGKSANFTAAREIEMYVRKQWMADLARLKANVIIAENKYNTINHLMTGWERFSFVLNTLSANTRAEAQASGVSSKNPYEHGDE